MGERLTWEEIQKKYPDQWVVLDEVKFGNGMKLISAIVIDSTDDNNHFNKEQEYLDQGKDYFCVRTRDNLHHFVGAMDDKS